MNGKHDSRSFKQVSRTFLNRILEPVCGHFFATTVSSTGSWKVYESVLTRVICWWNLRGYIRTLYIEDIQRTFENILKEFSVLWPFRLKATSLTADWHNGPVITTSSRFPSATDDYFHQSLDDPMQRLVQWWATRQRNGLCCKSPEDLLSEVPPSSVLHHVPNCSSHRSCPTSREKLEKTKQLRIQEKEGEFFGGKAEWKHVFVSIRVYFWLKSYKSWTPQTQKKSGTRTTSKLQRNFFTTH